MAKKHMHAGNTRLRSDTVTGVFEMADFLRWDELPPHCIRFVQRSANLKNCISFWKLAGEKNVHIVHICAVILWVLGVPSLVPPSSSLVLQNIESSY